LESINALRSSKTTRKHRPRCQLVGRARPSYLADHDWQTAHREWLPYWQQRDPVPPRPETPPEIETPGEVLSDRQEAFCRAYVECPVGAKAAVAAGYAPASARKQANRLLKHPLVVGRIHELRDIGGKDHQVRRDTIIDQAEAVFEAAMERHDFYAAMQALTMKARMAGFADYMPGVRILRREARDYEQEFWARAHAAEQRVTAVRLGEVAGAAIAGAPLAEAALEAKRDAEMFAEGAEAAAARMAMTASDARERRARAKRGLTS
jgi:phage terminase small subunit